MAPPAAPPVRPPIKPREQLVLSDEQLAEEFTKSLTANNPEAPQNIVRFSHKERGYKLEPMVEHLAVHVSRDGHKVRKDSQEAQEQRVAAKQRAAKEAEEAAFLRAALGETADDEDDEDAGLDDAQEEPPQAVAPPEVEEVSALDAEHGDGSAATPSTEQVAEPAEVPAAAPAPPAAAPAPAAPPPARFRNQFVYKERAMQTTQHASRDKAVCTEPAPKMDFSGTCSRAQIYEWYRQDARASERQRQLKEALSKRGKEGGAEGRGGGCARISLPSLDDGVCGAVGAAGASDESVLSSASFARAAKVLERMVSQNSAREIADDFKYWEDGSDRTRDGGEGTLLPLWSFSVAPEEASAGGEGGGGVGSGARPSRRRAVTSLAWHPSYADLFAVGYGSFDFLRPSSGRVACYSLKCPTTPECCFDTDSGVASLAFHPQHGALLALGLHDGTVAVHDIRSARAGQPLFAANARKGKHDDPVWQVAWLPDPEAQQSAFSSVDGGHMRGPLCFYSVSGDGRVALWTMTKSELSHSTLFELRAQPQDGAAAAGGAARPGSAGGGVAAAAAAVTASASSSDEALLTQRVGGTCFDFSPSGDGTYVVGTEEGGIYRCSTAYSSRSLSSYRGHSMAVYALRWNPFDPAVFLSGSADWSVQLWDSGVSSKSVMSFDLGAAVGDAAWAPYSSTVFAAAAADGRVHVFDLSVNKHEPLCKQKVVKKARLTKLAFNATHPVLLAGDDKGGVICLKLSPNLRKLPKAPEAEEETTAEQVQKARLSKIIELARKGDQATSNVPAQRPSGGIKSVAAPAPQEV